MVKSKKYLLSVEVYKYPYCARLGETEDTKFNQQAEEPRNEISKTVSEASKRPSWVKFHHFGKDSERGSNRNYQNRV
jgi:hypothetical protein